MTETELLQYPYVVQVFPERGGLHSYGGATLLEALAKAIIGQDVK